MMAVAQAQRGEGLHQSHSTGTGKHGRVKTDSRNQTHVKLSKRDGDTVQKSPSGAPSYRPASLIVGPNRQRPEKTIPTGMHARSC